MLVSAEVKVTVFTVALAGSTAYSINAAEYCMISSLSGAEMDSTSTACAIATLST